MLAQISFITDCFARKEQNLHLVKVLRRKKGDSITLFNGTGPEYSGKIIKTSLERTEILITSSSLETRKPKVKIHLDFVS